LSRSLLPLLFLGAVPVTAQDSSTDPILGRTVVTATRSPLAEFDAPYSTDVRTAEEILRRAYRTTPQILRDTPGVMVQETSFGQGSPYIRGFTGQRNLFLIDGIRLNNSVFRDGPNQYWNTVDPLSIERVEIVKGPSSVLYGSDAIGGVVNAITRNPYGYGAGVNGAGMLHYRVSSAEESHIVRGEASITSGDSLGVLVGGGGKDFGDFQAGGDLGTQENTGYHEYDVDAKVESFLDAETRLVFGYQHVNQNNVPRTHRTVFSESWEGTTVGNDLKRDLDQERRLVYVQLHGDTADDLFDSYHLSLSWQGQDETRDRIRGNGARDKQGFEVGTLGMFANFSSPSDWGRFTYGFDYYHDEVDSFSTSNPVQGPVADDATYDLFGIFVQDEIDAGERTTWTLGARFNYAAADANSVLDPVSGQPISLDDDWKDLVGSVRFVHRLTPDSLNLFGGVSQGFRAPNLSDLTRFDSARTDEFEIPSPGLDAEEYLSAELGLRHEGAAVAASASAFYTDISDAIVRVPTGNTNPDGEAEITKDNVGDGYVWGLELFGAWRFAPAWRLFGQGTYLEGKQDTFPTSAPVAEEEYLDRLMPLTLQLGVGWEEPDGRGWGELVGRWADAADRLSTRDESDTSRIPPGGTPDYLVFDLRGGWRLGRHVDLDLALENLTDEDFRIHGSGQNQPGRNFIFGLTVRR